MSDDLRDLSGRVAAFMDEREWGPYHSPRQVAAALAVEAAELQQLFLWRADDEPLTDRFEEVEAEAADVAICLLNFCNRAGIDLGDAVVRKLDDAARKYPVERVRGRREKYSEYAEWRDSDPE